MTRVGAWVLALICAAGWALPASAHPHIWIEYSATVLCRGDMIAGVRISWTFDQMYSASLFSDYTSRPSGPLGAADVAELKKGAFQDSSDVHYFTDIVLDGKALPVTQFTDFDASYDGKKMTYRFTVPLDIRLGRAVHVIDIDSFDPEFYIDYELVKNDPVRIQGGAMSGLSCEAISALKHTTTFGPLTTRMVRCRHDEAELDQ